MNSESVSRMKIHLRQIPHEGLHLEGEEDCPITELETDGDPLRRPAALYLDVGVSDGALGPMVRSSSRWNCAVFRCLEKFPYDIKVPAFRPAHRVARTGDCRSHAVDSRGYSAKSCRLIRIAIGTGDEFARRRAPKLTKRSEQERKPDWSALDKLKLKRRVKVSDLDLLLLLRGFRD